MKAGTWKTRTFLFLVVGLLVQAGVSSEVDVVRGAVPGRVCTPLRRDSSSGPACDGTAGGRRQRHPEGLRGGRERSVWWPGPAIKTSKSGRLDIHWMPCQAGGECVPFRLHLPCVIESWRQVDLARKGDEIFGAATRSPHLSNDPFFAGSRTNCAGRLGFSRSENPRLGVRRCPADTFARTGWTIRCDDPGSRRTARDIRGLRPCCRICVGQFRGPGRAPLRIRYR